MVNATWVPGVASSDPADREPTSLEHAVPLKCGDRVGRTTGGEPTTRGQCRGDEPLIDPHQPDQGHRHPLRHRALALLRLPVHTATSARTLRRAEPRQRLRSAANSWCAAWADRGWARRTTSWPAGTLGSSAATRCRSRRTVRWRTTELPTALETTNPTRTGPSSPGRFATWTLISALPLRAVTHRAPSDRPRSTARYCSGRRSRCAAGNTSVAGTSRLRVEHSAQADSFARPLARREVSTARPARVRIRRRKPCFLARRRLFGWKVRLLNVYSVGRQA